jgi:chromosome segregation ATPase
MGRQMANSEHGSVEIGELIEQRTKIENKLGDLVRDKFGALTRIRDLLRERSELEQDLDAISRDEAGLESGMERLREEIKSVSLEIEGASGDLGALELRKKKTEILQERASIEEKLDDITKRKVEALDKLKELTKKRSELEGILDSIEAEEIKLKDGLSDLKRKTEELIDGISREIGEMDSGKSTEIERYENVEMVHDVMKVEADEPAGKREVKTGIFGILGKSRSKKEHKREMEISTDDLLDIGLLKKVLGIMDSLLEKLPDDVIDEFSASGDFNRYDRFYSAIKGYTGKPDQREYIDENVRGMLETINNLLKKLPDDVIDEFSRSKDFDAYDDILKRYGVKQRGK